MYGKTVEKINRVLAMIVAIAVMVSAVPIDILGETQDEKTVVSDYTITVKNTFEEVIEGAAVTYKFEFFNEDSSNENGSNENEESLSKEMNQALEATKTTDENGQVIIDLTFYEEYISEDKNAILTYSVTAGGYVKIEDTVAVTSISETLDITLYKECNVRLDIDNIEYADILLNDTTDITVLVEEGTEIPIKIQPNNGYCIKNLKIGDDSKAVGIGTSYEDTITINDDITISGEIVEVHTISVVFAEESTGKASISVNEESTDKASIFINEEIGEIKIADGDDVEICITPEEKCYLKNVTNNNNLVLETGNLGVAQCIIIENITEDICISAEVVQTYTVAVEIKKGEDDDGNGTATVTMDGQEKNENIVDAGSEVTVKIEPTDNSRINKVLVNGSPEETTEIFEETITVNADTTITAEVIKQYVITITEPTGGTISVTTEDGTQISSGDAVDEGTWISVNIIAAKGKQNYWIETVKLNDMPLSHDDNEEYAARYQVGSDITIVAEFVQVFSVNVTSTQNEEIKDENGNLISMGTVQDENENAMGSVTLKKGTGIQIFANPVDSTKYRVCSVRINDNVQVENGENGGSYTFATQDIQEDYEIQVVFALNQYHVTADTVENATVEISNDLVKYGQSSVITVIPEENYVIEEVLINGTSIKELDISKISEEKDGINQFIFKINNITEDKKITVRCSEMKTLDISEEIEIVGVNNSKEESSAVRIRNDLYVFPSEITAVVRNINEENTGILMTVIDTEGNVETIFVNDEETTIGDILHCKDVIIITDLKVNRQIGGLIDVWQTVPLPDDGIKIAFDGTAPEVALTEDEIEYEVYSQDITVVIDVYEKENDFSGIAQVEYWITSDDVITQGKGAEKEDGTFEDGILYSGGEQAFCGEIIVSAEKNMSPNVVVYVKAVDKAGNVCEQTLNFKINPVAPKIVIEMEDEQNADSAKESYYTSRTVTVKIEDKTYTFEQNNVDIKITALDANGNEVGYVNPISEWTVTKKDGYVAEYTAMIPFDVDANYEWSISYINKAHLDIENNKTSNVTDTFAFTVDKTAPFGTISFETNEWSSVIEKLTFGLWKRSKVEAVATISDETSEIYAPLYYKSNSISVLSVEELEMLYREGKFGSEKISVSSDEKFVVYARLTDYAGNTSYISTDGIIIDLSKGVIQISPIEESNEYGFYNKDVDISISVEEFVKDKDAYSGIKEICYQIDSVNPETGIKNETKEGKLYSFSFTKNDDYIEQFGTIATEDYLTGEKKSKEDYLVYDELTSKWEGVLTLPAEEYNADSIVLTVMVEDNAGNTYEQEYFVGSICIDNPRLEVQFSGTANKVVEERGYFDSSRTAKLIITDRASAFYGDAATEGIVFSAVNAKGEQIVLTKEDVKISNWTSNGNIHTATVEFLKDGNYTFLVNNENELYFSYTNKADNTLEIISTGNAVTPCYFTVDTVAPTGSISINENRWANILNILTFGLYNNSKANVTATAEDVTSPVIMEYFKTSNVIAMGEKALSEQTFEPYEKFTIDTNEIFVVYLKITDYAGHITYCSTDGYIVDSIGSDIELKVEEPNENGLYNKDVKVDISIEDSGFYSGIKSIDYYVVADGNVEEPTQMQNLYNFAFTPYEDESQGGKLTVTDWSSGQEEVTEVEGLIPTYAHLRKSWSGSIIVEASKNNSCDVVLYVRVVDNAENESIRSLSLDFDVTKPEIKVSFDNNQDNNGNGYFNAARTATIVITERTEHFDVQAATNGITIFAVDARGNAIEEAYQISDWETVEGKTPDSATHTATISFMKDANYQWTITYTDKADNENSDILTGNAIAPFVFTVDTVKPESMVRAISAEGRNVEWSILRNDIRFGFWSKEKIVIIGATDDVTSDPTQIITQYYKVSGENAQNPLTEIDLEKIVEWQTISLQSGITIEEDEQFVVYLKMTDLAGNVTYVCTDGLIVDHNSPMLETIAPEITITPEQPINDIYSSDVKVDIKITDPLVNETYSGLKTLNYKVFNMGEVTQEGVLFDFEIEQPTQEELVQTWEGEIVVNSVLNNSNDVSILVYAEDNSLNSAEDSVDIKIDITAPTIEVSYTNNEVENEVYFKEDRAAVIVVTERNFDVDAVVVTITNTDEAIPNVGSWEKAEGSQNGNGDDTTWTATVLFDTDGDYTFDIECKDLAGNLSEEASYGLSVAATEFTIDKTLPVISVNYDNNNVQNDNYFNETRTATITIIEHNFSEENVIFTQSSALNGEIISNPSASWQEDGDIHIATIVYNQDGDYTFDISMQDLALNENEEVSYGTSVAATEFTIDQTIEKPIISGIENGKAYKGDISIDIEFSDINYASQEIHLYRTRKEEVEKEVTDEFIKALTEQMQGSSSFDNQIEKIQENDGIYRLYVKVQDKAGNEEEEEVIFTVNRFGSVYEYNDYLISLIENGGAYKQKIEEDLIITEYNADRLLEDSLNIEITCDGKPIENISYSMSPTLNEFVEIGESGWFQYEYIIKKENFSSDGVYKIFISSEDATGNFPENTNYEDLGILFRVDSRAPEITSIVGLENSIVNDTKIEVRYSVYDTIGLKALKIYLDGNVLQEVTDFTEDVNNYSGSFVINESTSAQSVRFFVEDMAGNITDTNAEDFESVYAFVKTVTVTTNAFVRWYADKQLFYGTIAGVAMLIGTVTVGVGLKKRKKSTTENS